MEKLMPWEITLQLCDAAGTTPKPQVSPPESSPASPKGNPRLHLVPLSKRPAGKRKESSTFYHPARSTLG